MPWETTDAMDQKKQLIEQWQSGAGRREIFFDRDPQLPQRTSAAAGRQATNGEPRRASACK